MRRWHLDDPRLAARLRGQGGGVNGLIRNPSNVVIARSSSVGTLVSATTSHTWTDTTVDNTASWIDR